jgi:hypothetical protein
LIATGGLASVGHIYSIISPYFIYLVVVVIHQGVRMKLKSTYSFLKAYFNYTTSGNRIYGRAVSEAMKVIRETMNEKTLSTIQTYLHKQFSLKLTKEMLLRLVSLAMTQYEDPFKEIQYFKITAHIDRSLMTTKHRGIEIPIEGGWDKKNNKLIILTFSEPKNIREEVSVIKGLIKEFVAPGKASGNIKIVAYWDLSKGKATEIDYEVIQPVGRQSLIDAANRIK